MNLLMDNYIRTYSNVLDEESCLFLIDKFDKSEHEYEDIHETNADLVYCFKQINMYNHDSWIGVREKIIKAMLYFVNIYKKECNIVDGLMWPSEYGYEAIRMKRYLPNDYDRFDDHVDSNQVGGCHKRFLNFLIYLNDVDEGGETEFPQMYKPGTYIPLSVKPKVGRMVIFPPMWPWLHAGRKPVSGPKYFVHSYLHYV